VHLSERILKRIDDLISTRPAAHAPLEQQLVDGAQRAACVAWLASVGNLIDHLLPDPESSYRVLARTRQAAAVRGPYFVHEQVAQMLNALEQIKLDVAAGLLTNLEARVSGETFDDLLDHADQYLKESRHEPAGVLAGVVFEDTIRRLCEKHAIEHRGIQLDGLLNALKAKNVLTKLEQKEGVAAADLRGNATHANWAAFNADQARTVVVFTRRIIRDKLAV